MLFETITINNFLSYNGTCDLSFDTGPTIVIGQNNTGKSKLFDAFNWVLFDQAYHTEDEKWMSTADWGIALVNSQAREEAIDGGVVSAEVTLSFIDEENNHCILSRNFDVTKEHGKWSVDDKSEIFLQIKNAITGDCEDFTDVNAENKIRLLFPTNLSRYFLFQGETISQLMSLSNKGAFRNALKDLSRIEVFDLAKEYADKTMKRCKVDLDKKLSLNLRLQAQLNQINQQIEDLKKEVDRKNKILDELIKNRDANKNILATKQNELSTIREYADLLKEIQIVEERMKLLNEQRSQLVNGQKSVIFEKWIYAGSEQNIRNFLELYKKNQKAKKIPEPIRQEFIKQMLEEKRCLVCLSDAPVNSERYNNINKLIDANALDEELALLNTISYRADSLLKDVGSIRGEISNYQKAVAELDQKILQQSLDKKAKELQLKQVQPKQAPVDFDSNKFAELKRTVDKLGTDSVRYELEISRTKSDIDVIKRDLVLKNSEYDKLAQGSTAIEETKRWELSQAVSQNVHKFYDSFFQHLIDEIQTEANKYYKKMTELNPALSGNVRVDCDISEVYTVDEDGNRLDNINQANKVSLQIAFIAAVLSVSNSFWEMYFPFIADAPTSALGGNNKIQAIKTIMDIFKQSIIIIKDDAISNDKNSTKNDELRNIVKTDEDIKNAYELYMTGEKLASQHTLIRRLK